MREMRVLNSSPPFSSDFLHRSCVLLPSSPSMLSVLSSLFSFFLSTKKMSENDRCPLLKTAVPPKCRVLFIYPKLESSLSAVHLCSLSPIQLSHLMKFSTWTHFPLHLKLYVIVIHEPLSFLSTSAQLLR